MDRIEELRKENPPVQTTVKDGKELWLIRWPMHYSKNLFWVRPGENGFTPVKGPFHSIKSAETFLEPKE